MNDQSHENEGYAKLEKMLKKEILLGEQLEKHLCQLVKEILIENVSKPIGAKQTELESLATNVREAVETHRKQLDTIIKEVPQLKSAIVNDVSTQKKFLSDFRKGIDELAKLVSSAQQVLSQLQNETKNIAGISSNVSKQMDQMTKETGSIAPLVQKIQTVHESLVSDLVPGIKKEMETITTTSQKAEGELEKLKHMEGLLQNIRTAFEEYSAKDSFGGNNAKVWLIFATCAATGSLLLGILQLFM